MPPKNEKKDEKQASMPKAKNFFDMDDDDEDVVAEEPAVTKNNTINKDRLSQLGANMRDLFHERGEDDLFAQGKEDDPVENKTEQKTEQSTVDRKQELKQEYPHLFYDGGTDLNDKMRGAETQPEQTAPEQTAPEQKTEQQPTPTNTEKKKLYYDEDPSEEEEDTLDYNITLDALKNKPLFGQPQPQAKPEPQTSYEDALYKVRVDAYANNPISVKDSLKNSRQTVQTESPKKKLYYDEDPSEEEEDTLDFNITLDALKNKPLFGQPQPQPQPQPQTTNKDTLEKLRKEVLTSKATRITKEELLNSNGILTVEDVFESKEPDEEVKKTEPKVEEKKPEEKKVETAKINDSANITVFINKLKTFNDMYKLNISADAFAASVTDFWTNMRGGDEKKQAEGKKMLNELFKDTLKKAFDVEKEVSYDEHRLPDYNEIIKSSNELLRVSMFAFTDLYHDSKSAALFEPTAFGGLEAKEMAELTAGKSRWNMDQKSDEAWEIQAEAAKNIAEQWLGDSKPYEKMINEMSALVEANEKGIIERREMLNKLAAAEWLLINNEKMMVENPEDPLNPIPNWGNRYWKAITSARESLGIQKHTSMREVIQGEYAASAKAATSVPYVTSQIRDYVLDPDVREVYDSIDVQKEQLATQSAAVILTEEPKPELKAEETNQELTTGNDKEKTARELMMEELRIRISVRSEDQREIMKNEPKSFNFIVDKSVEITIDGPDRGPKV